MSTEIIDPSTHEPYTLHLNGSAAGSFVGKVRMEYEGVLQDIVDHCCEPDIFQSDLAKRLIAYVHEVYGDEPEYLWERFPDNAIWRRKDNQKWYGALLTVSKRKLGVKSPGTVEIIDLQEEPDELTALVDGVHYFPGWHMNKKHWYTILLDGSVPFEEICERLNKSYLLSGKK